MTVKNNFESLLWLFLSVKRILPNTIVIVPVSDGVKVLNYVDRPIDGLSKVMHCTFGSNFGKDGNICIVSKQSRKQEKEMT